MRATEIPDVDRNSINFYFKLLFQSTLNNLTFAMPTGVHRIFLNV